MGQGIGCLCEECHYNKEKKCHADSILVTSSGDRMVNTSKGTQCDTFKHKQGLI